MSIASLEQATANLRVLVVDDNAALRGLLRVSLQAFGCHRVVEAACANRAMEILRTEHVDLLITDWKMKPRDGIDLVRELRDPMRSPAPYLPVVMLTAYSDAGRIREARNAGVNEFLIKPFTADALARRLRDVLTDSRDFIETDAFFGPDRRMTPRPSPTHAHPQIAATS